MALKLFQFAVFKDEKKDKEGNVVEVGKILVQPQTTLAGSEQQVAIMAAKAIPDEDMADGVDRISVVIVPF